MEEKVAETEEALRLENEELRERLRKAEEAIAAIRGGEVERERPARERADWLAAIIENFPAGMIVIEPPDGRVTMASERAKAIYASPPEGLTMEQHSEKLGLCRPDGTPYPPEDLPLSRSLRTGEVVRGEEMLIRRPGGEVTVFAYTAPLRSPEGEIVAAVGMFEDITERKRAEEALRESEERYRAIIEDQTEFVTRFEPETWVLTFVNEACTRAFGTSREELVGRSFMPLVSPEERERLVALLRSLTPERPVGNIEHANRTPRGVMWTLWTNRALFDEQGRLVEFQGIGRDITGRKQAQEALQQAHHALEARVRERTRELEEANRAVEAERQRLYSVLETLPVYAVLLTPDYRVPFANRFFRETFGEARGRRCYEYLFGRTQPCENCETYEVLDTKEPKEWEWTGPNGRQYDIHDYPFTDTDGSPLILEVGMDVTERHRAEEALRRVHDELEARVRERTAKLREANAALEEARGRIEELARREQERADWLAAILDQLPAGVVIASADGSIVLINRAVERLWGLRADEVRNLKGYGETWWVEGPDGRPVAREDLTLFKALRGETTPPQEEALVGSAGRRMPIICTALPLSAGEQPTGAVVVFWDISAQKEAQRQLQEASRLKDEFLSMASHELKTPVTSIKIFADLALRRPEAVKPDFLERVVRQADQLVRLVNDLLEVSRLGLGRMPVQLQPLDLAELVGEVCRRYVSEAGTPDCSLEDGRVPVKGDPVRLEQVLINLLDNAFKYSPEGGRVQVRVTRRGGAAVVEVRDEGIGIEPEHLPHIFERFYKPSRQQAVYSGLGVGLYISKQIVEHHGGRIWAESQLGKGSSFFVQLPLGKNLQNFNG